MAKVSKASAEYRDHPKGLQRCDRCIHFEPPHGCEGVAGKISPRGWCKRYLVKPHHSKWYGEKHG
jgi:hypothetical protein